MRLEILIACPDSAMTKEAILPFLIRHGRTIATGAKNMVTGGKNFFTKAPSAYRATKAMPKMQTNVLEHTQKGNFNAAQFSDQMLSKAKHLASQSALGRAAANFIPNTARGLLTAGTAVTVPATAYNWGHGKGRMQGAVEGAERTISGFMDNPMQTASLGVASMLRNLPFQFAKNMAPQMMLSKLKKQLTTPGTTFHEQKLIHQLMVNLAKKHGLTI